MSDDRFQPQSDHDLLIELRTELKGMRAEIRASSDDTKERLISLESRKLDKDTFSDFIVGDKLLNADHEKRLRFLERWGWAAWGAGWLIQFALVSYLMWRQFHP